MTPTHSVRPRRHPVTIDMLRKLNEGLSTSNPLDPATRAAALVAFWAQCRLGELLGSSKSHHDSSRLPSRRSLGPAISDNGSQELYLPITKTHQSKGESVVITAQHGSLNPITALHAHLNLSHNISENHHLFACSDPDCNSIICLTKDTFLKRCNSIWARNGIKRITGHAFRIGGTTGLLKAGVPPEVVRSMGRWASDAHFRYWRDEQHIALSHAEHIHTPNHTGRVGHRQAHAGPSSAPAPKVRFQGDHPRPYTIMQAERSWGESYSCPGAPAHSRAHPLRGRLPSRRAISPDSVDAIEQHDWVHLACHAHQNVHDPTESGFFLHDKMLSLATIIQKSFKNKGLAFLSACETATGDEKIADEAVHLASGMLMGGYPSVIATMWPVKDSDAPIVAREVYRKLLKEGRMDHRDAARALHEAVAHLRAQPKVGDKALERWAPYIHIGV
ncbi:hypothetical protein CTheo_7560 [Ceratobasidium theobromae]|uniref:CHAT domain-containing protein n=1 Tax=Ceratobasidium theobromae TaxID=1582974 RepID=A0A5N5QC35_9AGAM|nr:hypothetical protein CTheo_7560 [Ceratobasidium theobromae]